MIYVIDNKPYIRVANYYKEITIGKNGNQYNAFPKQGKNTKIENPDKSKIFQMTIEEYYEKNSYNKKTSIPIKKII